MQNTRVFTPDFYTNINNVMNFVRDDLSMYTRNCLLLFSKSRGCSCSYGIFRKEFSISILMRYALE